MLLDLSPMERSRTLSNKANKFDQQRLVGTKPEIKYRLKFVKKENTDAKDDENGVRGTNEDNGRYTLTPSRMLNHISLVGEQ